MIVLPAMLEAQVASWHALMDLHEHLDMGWTLVGGQMVHLHCAERGVTPTRPTDDADTVVDVRADPHMLATFTRILTDIGFTAGGISAEGLQHRWIRGQAVFDVLLPDGIGPAAASRTGITGSRTLTTPGGTQALQRTHTVAVSVHGREGYVRRPDLVGALVMKAAAHTAVGDPGRGRHRLDFATLAALVAARDFRYAALTPKDRSRLRAMITAVRNDSRTLAAVDDAQDILRRLETAIGLH